MECSWQHLPSPAWCHSCAKNSGFFFSGWWRSGVGVVLCNEVSGEGNCVTIWNLQESRWQILDICFSGANGLKVGLNQCQFLLNMQVKFEQIFPKSITHKHLQFHQTIYWVKCKMSQEGELRKAKLIWKEMGFREEGQKLREEGEWLFGPYRGRAQKRCNSCMT